MKLGYIRRDSIAGPKTTRFSIQRCQARRGNKRKISVIAPYSKRLEEERRYCAWFSCRKAVWGTNESSHFFSCSSFTTCLLYVLFIPIPHEAVRNRRNNKGTSSVLPSFILQLISKKTRLGGGGGVGNWEYLQIASCERGK